MEHERKRRGPFWFEDTLALNIGALGVFIVIVILYLAAATH